MHILRKTALGTLMIVLAGCNGTLTPVSRHERLPGYFTVNSGAPAPYLFRGSAVQWNQHYAVSADHIPLLPDVVHRCSTGCDLVFIRHDAVGPVPTWRPSIAGERIETVGQSPLFVTVKGVGTSRAPRIRLNRKGDDTNYALADAPVAKGMSGGPVYGADAAVIGVTVGMFQPTSSLPASLQNAASLSVYVPYEIVLREWKLFMERQAQIEPGSRQGKS